MKIIGITGKIGAGKSLVLEYLEAMDGSFVLESDVLAKSLYQKGYSVYKRVVEVFGADILDTETNEIDKVKLSSLVFADSAKLETLNSIVHPAVKEEILRLIEEKRSEGISVFFIEAALLIQDGYREICDEIWFIKADEETRIKRLMSSRGYSFEKCQSIIQNQPDDDYYEKNSDRIFDNTKDVLSVFEEIDKALALI
ncbi:MAG: dephospho-CoA kinase [Eubacterium sp.]|nr:dephospho-CoA kinase [Eubacterium sp.]